MVTLFQSSSVVINVLGWDADGGGTIEEHEVEGYTTWVPRDSDYGEVGDVELDEAPTV